MIESAQAWKLKVQILQTDEVRQRWPQISVPDGYIGVYEPQSGYLRCEQAVRSWIVLAERAGRARLFNCGVSEIGRNGELQQVVTADSRCAS
ncbi:N-methyl-L-tryptophan oxidase|nr:N-methyl-L-tryptophan oxidase [Candidatus Pantoea persica]